MSRYAIAVVILPPEQVMHLAIGWNRQLSKLQNQSIFLNEIDTLPHISLLMGCMSSDALRSGRDVLTEVVKNLSPISLDITGVRFTAASPPVAALDIGMSSPLLDWQRTLLEAFHPLITQDAVEDDLIDPPPVNRSSIDWINHFIPDQCGNRFWPHITLGHGPADFVQPSLNFLATRIAICHLGNHCTCRRILAEVSLTA